MLGDISAWRIGDDVGTRDVVKRMQLAQPRQRAGRRAPHPRASLPLVGFLEQDGQIESLHVPIPRHEDHGIERIACGPRTDVQEWALVGCGRVDRDVRHPGKKRWREFGERPRGSRRTMRALKSVLPSHGGAESDKKAGSVDTSERQG